MTRPAELADGELLRRMSAGDEDAFLTVYRRCQGPIYRFVLHMSGSPAIAEDVTQDVFLALIQDGSRFDASRGTLAAYLFGVSRKLLLRRWARDQIYVPLEADGTEHNEQRANGDSPHSEAIPDLAHGEMLERVRHAVLGLPVNYREVAVLCDLQEMSYEQAAATLGCPIGTVRSRLHRARLLLARKLQDLRNANAKFVARG